MQELLNHPPVPKTTTDPRFLGRDWRQIHVKELVDKKDIRWVELDTSVERATKVRFTLVQQAYQTDAKSYHVVVDRRRSS